MKCHEIRRQMDLFLDGELEVQQNMGVLEHLNLCTACASLYEGEKQLRGWLQQTRVTAPSHLRGTIESNIGAARSPFRFLSAAALLLIGMMTLFLFLPGPPSLEAATDSTLKARNSINGGICVGCCAPEELESFYVKTVGVQPCHHDFTHLGLYWQYATSCEEIIPGKTVCWLTYRDKSSGGTISQASFPASMLSSRLAQKIQMLERNGRVIVILNCGKMVCLFVTEKGSLGDKLLNQFKP